MFIDISDGLRTTDDTLTCVIANFHPTLSGSYEAFIAIVHSGVVVNLLFFILPIECADFYTIISNYTIYVPGLSVIDAVILRFTRLVAKPVVMNKFKFNHNGFLELFNNALFTGAYSLDTSSVVPKIVKCNDLPLNSQLDIPGQIISMQMVDVTTDIQTLYQSRYNQVSRISSKMVMDNAIKHNIQNVLVYTEVPEINKIKIFTPKNSKQLENNTVQEVVRNKITLVQKMKSTLNKIKACTHSDIHTRLITTCYQLTQSTISANDLLKIYLIVETIVNDKIVLVLRNINWSGVFQPSFIYYSKFPIKDNMFLEDVINDPFMMPVFGLAFINKIKPGDEKSISITTNITQDFINLRIKYIYVQSHPCIAGLDCIIYNTSV